MAHLEVIFEEIKKIEAIFCERLNVYIKIK